MLYTTELLDDTMSVIDSKTLECKWLRYDTVYKMLLDGVKIENIFVNSLLVEKDNTGRLSLSTECLRKHSGICKGKASNNVGSLFIGKNEPIPISKCAVIDLDFSVTLENVIIKSTMFTYLVWYNNHQYALHKSGIAGFYLFGKNLIVAEKAVNSSIEDIPIEVYDGSIRRSYCSRSQFMREYIFT